MEDTKKSSKLSLLLIIFIKFIKKSTTRMKVVFVGATKDKTVLALFLQCQTLVNSAESQSFMVSVGEN